MEEEIRRARLWHFRANLVRTGENITLVRLTHRADGNYFGNSSFRDFDFSGKLEAHLGRNDLLPKLKSLLAELGLRLPVPFAADAAAQIMGLINFPYRKEWEDAGFVDYSLESYMNDARLFWESRLHPKTFDELNAWLVTAARHCKRAFTLQDQAGYARMALQSYLEHKADLEAFYQVEMGKLSDAHQHIFGNLEALARAFIPENKRNEKKLGAAVRDVAEKKKKSRKKTVDYPSLFE